MILYFVIFLPVVASQCSICSPGTFSYANQSCNIHSVMVENTIFDYMSKKYNDCPILNNYQSNKWIICRDFWDGSVKQQWHIVENYNLNTFTYGTVVNTLGNKICNIATNSAGGSAHSGWVFPKCIFPDDTTFQWGCIDCFYGQYMDVKAATACKNCVVGSYSPKLRGTSCLNCSLGYSSALAAERCFPCPGGTYAEKNGTCTECGYNRFCEGGLQLPTNCSFGFLTLGSNSSSNADCCTR